MFITKDNLYLLKYIMQDVLCTLYSDGRHYSKGVYITFVFLVYFYFKSFKCK